MSQLSSWQCGNRAPRLIAAWPRLALLYCAAVSPRSGAAGHSRAPHQSQTRPAGPAGSAPPRCCSAGRGLQHAAGVAGTKVEAGVPGLACPRTPAWPTGRGVACASIPYCREAQPLLYCTACAELHPPMVQASPMMVRNTLPVVPALRTSEVCTSSRYRHHTSSCSMQRSIAQAIRQCSQAAQAGTFQPASHSACSGSMPPAS